MRTKIYLNNLTADVSIPDSSITKLQIPHVLEEVPKDTWFNGTWYNGTWLTRAIFSIKGVIYGLFRNS